jgi:hypothetical protein
MASQVTSAAIVEAMVAAGFSPEKMAEPENEKRE